MKTVLVIEDDKALRENTAEILELSNYKVITASNGIKGVKMAEKFLPDIIVCDIEMLELDGYGVFKNLSEKAIKKYIPFIFLSVKGENADIRKGMNLGVDDYITKPFTDTDLLSVVESRLNKALRLQNLEIINKNATEINNENEIKTLNDLKNFFDDNGVVFEFDKDNVIYREGDHSNYIYLIGEGAVKCYQIDEQGKELVTALYKEDDLFGYTSFTNYTPHKETAVAIDDVKLYGISILEFKNILENNHKLVLELIELLADNLSNLKEQLLEMAYSSVNKKTAATILKFAEKINHRPGDSIKVSRSDLASVAGIASETFVRALTLLKNEGIVKADGKNFKVIDLEKLRKIK